MTSCGLSSKQAADLLGLLYVNELIENNGELTIYKTTKKGYEFLTYYDHLCQLLQNGKKETAQSGSKSSTVRTIFRNHFSSEHK